MGSRLPALGKWGWIGLETGLGRSVLGGVRMLGIISTATCDLYELYTKMAAPVDERVNVPIDDPNADTEW